jgi:hypothetical protein
MLIKDTPGTISSEGTITKFLGIMKNLWLRTAVIQLLGSAVDVRQLVDLSQQQRIVAVGTVLAAIFFWIFSLPDVKELPVESPAQTQGKRTVQAMEFCTAALTLHGTVKLWDAWSQKELFARIFALSGTPTPFFIASALGHWRKTLTAAVSVWPAYEQVREKLGTAQVNFYSQVATFYRNEVIFKIILSVVALVKTYFL